MWLLSCQNVAKKVSTRAWVLGGGGYGRGQAKRMRARLTLQSFPCFKYAYERWNELTDSNFNNFFDVITDKNRKNLGRWSSVSSSGEWDHEVLYGQVKPESGQKGKTARCLLEKKSLELHPSSSSACNLQTPLHFALSSCAWKRGSTKSNFTRRPDHKFLTGKV